MFVHSPVVVVFSEGKGQLLTASSVLSLPKGLRKYAWGLYQGGARLSRKGKTTDLPLN